MGKRRQKETTVRIIGGHWRGRRLQYSGDPRTRPMKDRTREAIFNLVGPAAKNKLAIDFFAGTGALALEALSRGAAQAICVERHFPSARLIRQNTTLLDAEERVETVGSDAFLWADQCLPELSQRYPDLAWLLFFSPPYDFYVDRLDEMLQLIRNSTQYAPAGSLLVVESDKRFATDALPQPEDWDVRYYSPAQICILELSVEEADGDSEHS